MNDMIPFQFEQSQVRAISDDQGEPWFVLRDLLDAMQSRTKTTDAVESIVQGLGDGFVNDVPILDALGRDQQAIIVSESAATYLLSRSNTDTGRRLNRFIHVEVLPELRKTGRYESRSVNPAGRVVPLIDANRLFRSNLSIAKLVFSGNQAVLSANMATRKATGYDVLGNLGATHLLADPRGRTYTPTELGKMAEPALSGQKLNKLLEEKGLQLHDIKGGWVPTDAADGLAQWLDTAKRHSDGTPVKQLKWFVGALDRLGVPYRQIDSVAA